jgi:hypothetical protein
MSTLLITLGDSWTQGVGCYEPELREKLNKGEATMQELFLGSFELFSKCSWVTHAARILNADVKNIALGGDANSASAKRLLMGPYSDCKKYYDDVIVVFLMTDPARFSFFNDHIIQSFLPGNGSVFMEEFLKHCLSVREDEAHEALFYLTVVKNFCEANGYHFYYGSAFSRDVTLPRSKPLLHPEHSAIVEMLPNEVDYMSDICYHPNEKGYHFIGEYIGNYIKQDLTNSR